MNYPEGESAVHSNPTHMDKGNERARDVLQDFWQATLDLHSYLSQAQANQQHDVTVPAETLKALLESVETVKTMQHMQEKRSVASLYLGTILGALIGIIGNFFVSFWFMPQHWWTIVGLAVSFILLAIVCISLFTQSRKYVE